MKEIENVYFSIVDSRFTIGQIDALVKSFSIVFRKKLEKEINAVSVPFTIRVFVNDECLFSLLPGSEFDFITGDVPNVGQDVLDYYFYSESFEKFVNILDISIFRFEEINRIEFNGENIQDSHDEIRYNSWLINFFDFMIGQISILLHSKCGSCKNIYTNFPQI